MSSSFFFPKINWLFPPTLSNKREEAGTMKSSIFKVQFDDSVKEYNKVDGILAIAYFFYEIAFAMVAGFFIFHTNLVEQLFSWSKIPTKAIFTIVLYIPIALIEAGPVFIILKCRKQSLKSIGLKKEKILKCILLGILFSIPPTLCNAFSMKFGNMLSLLDSFWMFVYDLFEIAFVEEIIFRGFIQTRIQGLIRSKWTSIILVGIMFSLSHIPFNLFKYNVSLVGFVTMNFRGLITTCLIHIYFVYLYTRDNNIFAPVVAHAIMDFIPVLFSAM